MSRSLGHRAPLLWLLLPWMAGLVLAHAATGPLPVGWLLAAGAVAMAVAVGGRERPGIRAGGVVAALALAGAAAGELSRERLPDWDRLPPREARVALRVGRLFATPADQARRSGVAHIIAAPPHLADLKGQRVYFSVATRPGDLAPETGAEVEAAGLLTPLPKHPAAGTFDAYLADTGINFKLTRGRITEVWRGPGAYRRFCAAAERRLDGILGLGLEERRPELAGVLRAMMLGRKQELNDGQKELFMRSGTMHLFAISGLHIVVIAGAIEMLLLLVRLPSWARFVFGTAALWLYVDITGAPPSAVRAFVMVIFLHAAWRWRVPGNSLAALTASALCVLLAAPGQMFTASFQMSYGIVAALLLYGLPLSDRWQERRPLFAQLPPASWTWRHRAADTGWRWLLTALAMGVAATLVSTVSGVQFFGLFTPAGFFANLALIPASAVVLVAGFVSLLCGLVGLEAGSVLCNHAAALTLWGMEAVARGAVAVPGLVWPAAFRTAWAGGWLLAALLAAMAFGYQRRWDAKTGGWWPPVALVLAALVLAVRFG